MDAAQELEAAILARQQPMYEAMQLGTSPMQQFYKGAVVFITGASGFLGKHLVEKLFRSADIKKIYILLRSKKGKTLEQRLDAILKDPLFDYLHSHQPQFQERLVPVEGDVTQLGLGIGNGDWMTLAEEVDVIFHVAATTRFDEPLAVAALTNVRGTREALRLGLACKHLKSFVHVSTAFAFATESRIGGEVEERLYPSPMPPAAIIQLAEEMDAARLDCATANLIKDWPNTYVFTKAIAEEQVRIFAGEIPVCIMRPPIVISAHKEPSPGWIDTSAINSISGIITTIGLGVGHVVLVKDVKVNLAPVDYVNNATLAAAWDTADTASQLPIYNISSTGCQLTFGLVIRTLSEVRWRFITPKAIWYTWEVITGNPFIYWLLTWLFHYIPAYIVDAVCALFRIKIKEVPSAVKFYTKLYRMSLKYSLFARNEWIFKDDNLRALFSRMSPTDQLVYNFDIRSIDWKEMVLVWCIGLRKYIIKDGLRDTAYGVKKQKILRIVHYLAMTLYLYVVWKLFSFAWCIVQCFFELNNKNMPQ